MPHTVIERVRVVPGRAGQVVDCATVVLDADGVVDQIVPTEGDAELLLVPAAVDLHLDNLSERRRPRATVNLDQAGVLANLDAECAAAGIGVVCIAARCEESPGKGIVLADAVELAEVVEVMAPHLACDWRLHARVEVTDDGAVETLAKVLAASTRVALVSYMEHSVERSRFGSADAHRRFYAEDWGVSLDEVDRILASKRDGAALADERRGQVAALARIAGIVLASHDDRTPGDVDDALALGARIAEFPLTLDAAHHAQQLGMLTVLGAPNAVRGRSTSTGNLLVADAVADGACDVLCSDYLPSSMQEATHALVAGGSLDLNQAVDLVAANPADVIGVASPMIAEGVPLTASLRRRVGGLHVGISLWRDGALAYQRRGGPQQVTAMASAR